MSSGREDIAVIIPAYDAGQHVLRAVKSLLTQRLPEGTSLSIVVVDDGSQDDTAARISTCGDERVEFLRLAENRGRSTARNEGARHVNTAYIAFMDCDCVPADDSFLAEHLKRLQGGAIASVGHIVGSGDGFWDRYQREASQRREQHHRRGHSYAATSANFAVIRSAFVRAGGFDPAYRHYGFEDRDLLIRLAEYGEIAWAENAVIQHLDQLNLPTVSRKMIDAGRHSSGYFAAKHPHAYTQLGFAAFDARLKPWLRPVAALVGPRLLGAARRIQPLLEKRQLPYPLARSIVRIMNGLCFLYGTTNSEPD